MTCDFCGCKLQDEESTVIINGCNESQFALNLCEDCFDQKYGLFEIEEAI